MENQVEAILAIDGQNCFGHPDFVNELDVTGGDGATSGHEACKNIAR